MISQINNYGERIPLCRTPHATENGPPSKLFHFTEQCNPLYHIFRRRTQKPQEHLFGSFKKYHCVKLL